MCESRDECHSAYLGTEPVPASLPLPAGRPTFIASCLEVGSPKTVSGNLPGIRGNTCSRSRL